MSKIKKNLSDADMLVNWHEEVTFETDINKEEPIEPKRGNVLLKNENLNNAFFTEELREKVGKALLELKVSLFNEGITDYTIKVEKNNKQVILTAVPVEVKRVAVKSASCKKISKKL